MVPTLPMENTIGSSTRKKSECFLRPLRFPTTNIGMIRLQTSSQKLNVYKFENFYLKIDVRILFVRISFLPIIFHTIDISERRDVPSAGNVVRYLNLCVR